MIGKASIMEKYCSLKSAFKSPSLFIDLIDLRFRLSVKKVRIRHVSEIIFRGYLNVTHLFAILIRISCVELIISAVALGL